MFNRVIANQFGVHKCTVKKIIYMFCKGMVRSVISQLVNNPMKSLLKLINLPYICTLVTYLLQD